MNKIAWLATNDGFEQVRIIEVIGGFRSVEVIGGERAGQTLVVPPVGVPHNGFHPALYEGSEKPNVWSFKGRSLPVHKPSDFAHPAQAEALVPQVEPYTLLPHTMQVIDGVLAGDHQLLFGGTGVGKTSLILQIAARIGQPVIRLNLNGQVSISDLLGNIGFTSGGTSWSDGALPRAMRNGYWLILDEIDFGSPDILCALYPILEAKPQLCLKEHDGEVVAAHPNFRVFATGNSIGGDRDGVYHGTQALNAALLNRFTGHGQVIKIEPMKPKQEREMLLARLPSLSRKLARRVCDLANRLRHGDGQTPGLLPTLSTREIINYCHKLMLYRDTIKAAHVTFLGVVQDENIRQPAEQAIALVLGRRIGAGRAPIPAAATGAAGAIAAVIKEPKTPRAIAPAGVGRVASEVTDPDEIKGIWAAYKGNGGGLSYEQIERDPRFNLRAANGNTAYRIVKKHERMIAR